jgi:large subunit ribosomal protein L18
MQATQKRAARVRRHRRVRKKIHGATGRPRLAVYRSNRHIYAQLVDDTTGRTILSASSMEEGVGGAGDKKAAAKAVGGLLAGRAKDAGIERATFDRGGRLYHGRVKALAEGAREGGLQL